MSVWELRRWMESAVPAWVPFAIVGALLLSMWVFAARRQ